MQILNEEAQVEENEEKAVTYIQIVHQFGDENTVDCLEGDRISYHNNFDYRQHYQLSLVLVIEEAKYYGSKKIPNQKLYRFAEEPGTFSIGKFSKVTCFFPQVPVYH